MTMSDHDHHDHKPGEIDWREHGAAREWYTRVKSRPSFRSLLADRVRGLSPVSHYADLDF